MASFLGQLLVELGINTAAFKSGLDKSTYQTQKFAKDVSKEFSELGKGIADAFKDLGSFLPSLQLPINALSSAFSTVEKAATGAASGSIGTLGAVGIAATGAVAAILAIGAAWGEAAIAGGEYAQHLDLISQKTGISIRDLQTFEAAGKTVGVGLEDIVTASRKFDQALADTGKSAAAQQAVLHALGVTSKDPKEALLQVADAFSHIEDPTVKASDAIALFGKSGLNLIPLLNKGREGLQEFDAIVGEFGPHITKDGIEKFDQWEVATTKLSLSWANWKNEASGILPVISAIVTGAAKATKGIGDFLKGGGGINGLVNAAVGGVPEPSTTKEDDAARKKLQATQTQIALDKEAFEIEKAGSTAQYALDLKRQEIADDIAAQNYKAAAAAQAEIPALQAKVDLEKQRLEAIKAFPANVTKARDAIVSAFADIAPKITDPIEAIDAKTRDAIAKLQALDVEVGDKVFGATFQGGLAGAIHQLEQMSAILKDNAWQQELEKISAAIGKLGLDAQKLPKGLAGLIDFQGANTALPDFKPQVETAQEYTIALQKLHSELRRGTITEETYKTEVKALQDSMGGVTGGIRMFFDELKATQSNAAIDTFNILSDGVRQFGDALAQTIATGKADWAGLIASMEEALLKSSLAHLFNSILGALNNSDFFGGLGGGNLFGSGGIFGGAKAGGGDVSPGKTYLVGERGPELFQPGSAGTIIPNGAASGNGGGGVIVNQTINTPDANSFRQSARQLQDEAFRSAAQAHARMRS